MTRADTPFNRWSLRKRGLDNSDAKPDSHERAGMADDTAEQLPEEHGASAPEPIREAGSRTEEIDAPPPEGSLDHTLPDPDSLGPGADFKGYLVPGVSAALKRRALRRLYTTGNYNVRDGLDDYDLDYSQMGKLSVTASASVRQWGKKALETFEERAHAQPRGDEQSADECPCDAMPSGTSEEDKVSSPRRTAGMSGEESHKNDSST
ncbi:MULTISPECIES: DUF3306 domain-containing protein [Halomonadaceae]|uniref:DUF3306 domain-containing protein n=1 Tax=Halomonadaceae TaxID=28256 RepID=UPI00159936D4|nr:MULTISPECIES: DUF3306 domain-containing protein [Halomonas]QJQ96619.1 DUF3306 domain-containing protein [Halomonas sp. PA5]